MSGYRGKRKRCPDALLHRGPGLDAHGFIALPLEHREDLVGMRTTTRLHGDVELRALGRNVEEPAAVIDLKDVDAEIAEQRRDLPEHTGAVRDRQPERNDAAFAFELAHHDGR